MWAGVLPLLLATVRSQDEKDKIFGGRVALRGEFPFAVLIRIKETTVCGGSLFSLNKIITSAHCFMQTNGSRIKPEDISVYADTISVTVDHKWMTRKVKYYKIHDKYEIKGNTTYNDIAMATLISPFLQSEYVKPFTIVAKDSVEFKKAWDELVKAGRTCLAIGWGEQKTKELGPLTVVEFKPWDDDKCSKSTNNAIVRDTGLICAEAVNQGESICVSDSGGPFICDNSVYGVLTGVRECGKQPFFGLLFYNYLDYFGLKEAALSASLPFFNSQNYLPTNLCIIAITMLDNF